MIAAARGFAALPYKISDRKIADNLFLASSSRDSS